MDTEGQTGRQEERQGQQEHMMENNRETTNGPGKEDTGR